MIELQKLSRTFLVGEQTVRALDQVDLLINRGEYLSVMGPSGSGKSTLLNILGLLDRPNAGEYLLNQQATSALKEERRAALRAEHIGFVFQSYHLIPRMSARENIELPMVLRGIPAKQRRTAVDDILKRLGLSERATHLPKQLSGGQRQRVAIGRAIVMKPQILLADEPTGNLDSVSGREVAELLEELNNDGITLIVVTHDHDIGERATRRITMIDGRIAGDKSAPSPASASDSGSGSNSETLS